MGNTLLIILIIAHLLGDFYLQSDTLADNKKEKYKHILIHGAFYAIPVVLFGVFKLDMTLLWLALFYVLSHLVIDTVKFLVRNSKNSVRIYILDQVMHLISLVVLAIVFRGLAIHPEVEQLFENLGVPFISLLKGILLFLIILKPTNVTHQHVFINLKPISDEADEKKTGAIIGGFERLLIALLLMVGQYTAIGLVITGKSIARYDKIAKDKAFAEYYLIGTFYSILAVLIPYLILIKHLQ